MDRLKLKSHKEFNETMAKIKKKNEVKNFSKSFSPNNSLAISRLSDASGSSINSNLSVLSLLIIITLEEITTSTWEINPSLLSLEF